MWIQLLNKHQHERVNVASSLCPGMSPLEPLEPTRPPFLDGRLAFTKRQEAISVVRDDTSDLGSSLHAPETQRHNKDKEHTHTPRLMNNMKDMLMNEVGAPTSKITLTGMKYL